MVKLRRNVTALPSSDDANVILSVVRIRLSYDQRLMSWLQTTISLITFGFSIYKFFQIEAQGKVTTSPRLVGPREFAIMMIAIGLTSLLLATLEHSRDVRALKADYPNLRLPGRSQG